MFSLLEIVNQSQDFKKSENVYKIIEEKKEEEENLDESDKEKIRKYKYVQIKVQDYLGQTSRQKIVQINDMTASVMFNIAQGEKQLLSLINATVSHEMRNPINSISNQIL